MKSTPSHGGFIHFGGLSGMAHGISYAKTVPIMVRGITPGPRVMGYQPPCMDTAAVYQAAGNALVVPPLRCATSLVVDVDTYLVMDRSSGPPW